MPAHALAGTHELFRRVLNHAFANRLAIAESAHDVGGDFIEAATINRVVRVVGQQQFPSVGEKGCRVLGATKPSPRRDWFGGINEQMFSFAVGDFDVEVRRERGPIQCPAQRAAAPIGIAHFAGMHRQFAVAQFVADRGDDAGNGIVNNFEIRENLARRCDEFRRAWIRRRVIHAVKANKMRSRGIRGCLRAQLLQIRFQILRMPTFDAVQGFIDIRIVVNLAGNTERHLVFLRGI